jgi:DNA polymerase I
MKVIREFSDEEFILNAKRCGVFAFDVEHSPSVDCSSPLFEENFWGVGLATFRGDEILASFYRDLDAVGRIMTALDDCEAVAYNGKYDMKCLKALGMPCAYPANLFDPMVAVNLLEDSRRPNQLGLKIVVKDYYKYEMAVFKDASSHGPDSKEFSRYAVDDVVWEIILWKDLKPKLVAQKLDNLFYKILMPVSRVFADMEFIGMRWDSNVARELLLKFADMREHIRKEIIEQIGELNLNSGDQIATRLFEDLGYSSRGIEMTKSGSRFSTDSKAMATLAKKYPVCDKIVKYRMCEKMLGTYIEPLTRRALEDPLSRIHPTYWLVSSTGRTRCEKPNLQNLPAYMPEEFGDISIRKCFVPESGRKLIVADLSQIELRLMAHISKDEKFLSAYVGWECKSCNSSGVESDHILHSCPLCGVEENEKEGFWHGLDLHSMTANTVSALKGNRQAGKQANFALIYLAQPRRMNEAYPDMSIGEWEEAIDQFMETYSGIRMWHVQSEYKLKAGGVAVDIFGRKRRISRRDVRSNFKHALNQFVNFPVQSSACAYIELCLVRLRESLIERGIWLNGVWPVNFVHDEIVLEVDDDLVEEVSSITLDMLENSVKLCVPIRADLKVVSDWGAAK